MTRQEKLEYYSFIGAKGRKVFILHLHDKTIKLMKSKLAWFIVGLISGCIGTGILLKESVPVLNTILPKTNIVYIPAISIDSNTKAFMNAIATFESGGDYSARRPGSQYLGKYQIGDAARIQLGYGSLNTKAGYQQFLNTPELQDVIMYQLIRYNKHTLQNVITKYSNTKVGAYYLTESGILAMAQSCGAGGVKLFISSGGKTIPRDGNNKLATDYLQFNGFKIK